MSHPYEQFQDTPLWRALNAALAALEENGELTVATRREYVVGFLAQQLSLRHLLATEALGYDP